MRIEHLRIFIAVYRSGGFAFVAKELNVAPSSISRVISGLESKLKVRLFQRTTRQLAPTHEGRMFFERIEGLVEEFDVTTSELLDQTLEPAGRLRVTSSVSYGQKMIVPVLRDFNDMYPKIEIELILSDHNVDLVGEQIDIAIRHGVLADSSLVARKLHDVSYRVVASPNYIANANPISCPSDITDHPSITFPYDGFSSSWSLRQRDSMENIPIKALFTISNAEAIRKCVCDGIGIAMLADWIISQDLASGRLVNVLPEWRGGVPFDSSIWIIFPSRSYVPEKVRAFRDFIIDKVK